jgi:poly-gamma-glutamate capsule biosynthesis protein CapA/YwtB (metallophosphatase superfamily)
MSRSIKFTAVGDVIISRRLCAYDGFPEIAGEIRKGDFRFFNLETTIHDYESFPSQFSGGGWLCAPRGCVEDCRQFGFNVSTMANNHSLDYSYDGLKKSLKALKDADLPCAGAGKNLYEASEPVYVDSADGRVALIAVTSAFHPTAMAGEQSVSMQGRPGVNGLRFRTVRRLEQKYADQLQKVAAVSGVNDFRELARNAGYMPPLAPGKIEFDNLTFEVGEKNETLTFCNKQDLERIRRSIYEAQLQADAVVISLHTHEFKGKELLTPPDFIREFARFCIDNGADAIVGHGPHFLRPVEIYKGKPVFYSLGNFIFQNENMTRVPPDFCATVGLPADSTVRDVLKARSRNFTCGYQCMPEAFETVIPCWEMEKGKVTAISLLAAELGYGKPRSSNGWPVAAKGPAILEKLAEMSRPYGTEMIINGNRATIVP